MVSVHYVSQGFSGQIPVQVVQGQVDEMVQGLGQMEKSRDVGGNEGTGHIPEGMVRRQGFRVSYIQPHPFQVTALQQRNECIRLDGAPPTTVEKDGARFHFGQPVGVHQSRSLGRVGQAKADYVCLGQHLIQVVRVEDAGHVVGYLGPGPAYPQHTGSQGSAEPGVAVSNVSQTNDQDGGAPETGHLSLAFPKVKVLTVPIGVEPFHETEGHGQEMLGNGLTIGSHGGGENHLGG